MTGDFTLTFHRLAQVHRIKRLQESPVDPKLNSDLLNGAAVIVRVSSHDEGCHARVAAPKGAEQTEAVESWHRDIRHQDVENPPVGELEGLNPVSGRDDAEEIASQEFAAQFPDLTLVVYDKNDRSKVETWLMWGGARSDGVGCDHLRFLSCRLFYAVSERVGDPMVTVLRKGTTEVNSRSVKQGLEAHAAATPRNAMPFDLSWARASSGEPTPSRNGVICSMRRAFSTASAC
jgi:hypothetical protein